jgi:anti-sigma factor (TIGR02949 family)
LSVNFDCSALHSYFDRELSADKAAEFERHLEDCAVCVAELDACDSIRNSLRRAQLYDHAPASLRKKIYADLRPEALTLTASRTRPWYWLAVAAAILLVAFIGWRMSSGPSEDYQAEVAAEIVDAHVRSLQPGHLTVLASNDGSAVKAWFDSKLKFSFPVHDFANDGFPLQGGRVDVVEGRSVAAVVYSRYGRPVNVFVWPVRERDTSPREGSRQGYQWIDWRKGKIEFCAVSDAPAVDLAQLQGLLVEQSRLNGPKGIGMARQWSVATTLRNPNAQF